MYILTVGKINKIEVKSIQKQATMPKKMLRLLLLMHT
jgi:hypothetical protein